MNKVVLMGRLTRDPDVRYSQGETPLAIARYTLAVDRRFKRNGEQDADFINCVAWNKTAETLSNYVSKGTMIGVEGRLQVRSYENEAGVRQYISEVLVNKFTFLESKKSSAMPEPVEPFNYQQQNSEISSHHSFHSNDQVQENTSTSTNYNNPFITATTLAGGLNSNVATISISDDDLPF